MTHGTRAAHRFGAQCIHDPIRRFNGDADGICALHQWRLAHPAQSELVTGVKRDNALLARVPAQAGDEVIAFDIALPGNL